MDHKHFLKSYALKKNYVAADGHCVVRPVMIASVLKCTTFFFLVIIPQQYSVTTIDIAVALY